MHPLAKELDLLESLSILSITDHDAQAISASSAVQALNSAEKSLEKDPLFPPVYMNRTTTSSSSITPRAGVAQLVERVALITAKRSTSRSWVRAPPSAIPIISSSSEQLFFFPFCQT